jgi:cobalamin biosynthesis Mg chelatase CobN
MKVRKKFFYRGIELSIVEREESYMNSIEPMIMTRVITPNGNTIPILFSHRDTLKVMVQKTIELLDGFSDRGANVIEELNKK